MRDWKGGSLTAIQRPPRRWREISRIAGRGRFTGMNATPITIRPYLPPDRRSLVRLAALDDRRVPVQPVILAERGGRLVAAISERTGEAVADPFEPTAHLVAMLRARP